MKIIYALLLCAALAGCTQPPPENAIKTNSVAYTIITQSTGNTIYTTEIHEATVDGAVLWIVHLPGGAWQMMKKPDTTPKTPEKP